jgi:hypothetical protein
MAAELIVWDKRFYEIFDALLSVLHTIAILFLQGDQSVFGRQRRHK